jgi:hypothetical protein
VADSGGEVTFSFENISLLCLDISAAITRHSVGRNFRFSHETAGAGCKRLCSGWPARQSSLSEAILEKRKYQVAALRQFNRSFRSRTRCSVTELEISLAEALSHFRGSRAHDSTLFEAVRKTLPTEPAYFVLIGNIKSFSSPSSSDKLIVSLFASEIRNWIYICMLGYRPDHESLNI